MKEYRKLSYQVSIFVNVILLTLSFLLMFKSGFTLPVVAVAISSFIIPLIILKMLGDNLLSRLSFGTSFMFLTALNIHQTAGMIELSLLPI